MLDKVKEGADKCLDKFMNVAFIWAVLVILIQISAAMSQTAVAAVQFVSYFAQNCQEL